MDIAPAAIPLDASITVPLLVAAIVATPVDAALAITHVGVTPAVKSYS